EILHGAYRTVEVHIGLMRAPEHNGAGTTAVAGDADPQRRLNDPLELEPAIGFLPLVGEHPRGLLVRRFKGVSNLPPDSNIPDNNEIPWLHKADRRGSMRRTEQARQHLIRNWIGHKLRAHITAIEDAPIYGIALCGRELRIDLNIEGFQGSLLQTNIQL